MSNLTPLVVFVDFLCLIFLLGVAVGGSLQHSVPTTYILKVNKSKIKRKPNKNTQVLATEEQNFKPRTTGSGDFPTRSDFRIGEKSLIWLSIQSRDSSNIC